MGEAPGWEMREANRADAVPGRSALAGAAVILLFDLGQAVLRGGLADEKLIFEQPLKWAAVSVPLWTAMLAILLTPGMVVARVFGGRRG